MLKWPRLRDGLIRIVVAAFSVACSRSVPGFPLGQARRAMEQATYYVNTEAKDVSVQAIQNTFTAWMEATGYPFVYGGRVRAGIRRDGRNAVSFLRRWPRNLSPSLIAYCKNWYDSQGRIVESDIAFNLTVASFTSFRSSRPGAYYIERVLSHEIGHMMGLVHSNDPQCIMYPKPTASDTQEQGLVDAATIGMIRALYPRFDRQN